MSTEENIHCQAETVTYKKSTPQKWECMLRLMEGFSLDARGRLWNSVPRPIPTCFEMQYGEEMESNGEKTVKTLWETLMEMIKNSGDSREKVGLRIVFPGSWQRSSQAASLIDTLNRLSTHY